MRRMVLSLMTMKEKDVNLELRKCKIGKIGIFDPDYQNYKSKNCSGKYSYI